MGMLLVVSIAMTYKRVFGIFVYLVLLNQECYWMTIIDIDRVDLEEEITCYRMFRLHT